MSVTNPSLAYYFLYTLNILIMVIMPLIFGWLIHKKRRISWSLFGIGAVTFILSQVVHIPFNLIMIPRINEQLAGFPEVINLIGLSIFLGLSAGIFEEGARYLTYRYWANSARSWGQGMMLGAGHGGVESIILGVLVGVNFFFYFSFIQGRFTSLIPADQQSIVNDLLDSLFTVPWYDTILGAFERFFTLFVQMALSLIVLQAFTRKKMIWLLVAIGWHTFVDAFAVFAVSTWGAYVVEGFVAIVGLFSLGIIYYLKTPEPEKPVLPTLPELQPIPPIAINITKEKIEDSRFS